jgi:hypothetical protein
MGKVVRGVGGGVPPQMDDQRPLDISCVVHGVPSHAGCGRGNAPPAQVDQPGIVTSMPR